jgi:hypothetical protein
MASSTARGNRIYRLGDNDSVVVLPVGSAIPNIANPEAAGIITAEGTAGCQTASATVRGVKKLDVFVDVATNAGAANLYLKFRFSDKDSPDVTNPLHWGFVLVDNIDTATGISSVQEYIVKIPLDTVNGTANTNQPRRFSTRITDISGIFASAIIWADGTNTVASVTFVRHS